MMQGAWTCTFVEIALLVLPVPRLLLLLLLAP
jgi:hypothetical protein